MNYDFSKRNTDVGHLAFQVFIPEPELTIVLHRGVTIEGLTILDGTHEPIPATTVSISVTPMVERLRG